MPSFGFNVNNREPLLNEEYTVSRMLDLGKRAEEVGFDSVWVGDNLMEKPRHEPISLLSVLADRTESVDLGTACMISTLRHPVQFAQSWTTLDVVSGGRTILGACQGTPDEMSLHQHEMVGVPPEKRHMALEEGIEIMKTLWETGSVDRYEGEIYDIENATFDTGNESVPFRPVRGGDTPVIITANPSYHGNQAVLERVISRIVVLGDGWLTGNRWHRPEEYSRQLDAIHDYADEQGVDPDDIGTYYQITVNINESREDAIEEMDRYIDSYYPYSKDVNYDSWGPIGDPQQIIDQIQEFYDRGCEHFIIRLGTDDHSTQLERFANEVLPSFQ